MVWEDLLNRNIIDPIYLACFCDGDNLLSQWRTYGQSGGYSLGFKVPNDEFTNQGFKPEPNTYTSKWVKVEYDKKEQARKCGAILDSLLEIFHNQDATRALATISEHPLYGYSKILRAITDILLEEIVGFKNEAFQVQRSGALLFASENLPSRALTMAAKHLCLSTSARREECWPHM